MSVAILGQYQPGNSVVHRISPGIKLLGLAGLSLAVVAIPGPGAATGFFGLSLILALLARLRLRPALRQLRGVLIISLVIAGFQWWLSGPLRAIEALLDLTTLALLGIILMATTTVAALQDVAVRSLGALPWVDAERVGLVISLAIQAFPGSIQLALETRDAALARNLGRNPRSYLAPYVVRMVAKAQLTGDALAARGLGE